MTYLFYLITIVWVIVEFVCLKNTQQVLDVINKTKNKQRKLSINENTFLVLQLFYAIWGLIGLFSSQYIIFILLTALSFLVKQKTVISIKINSTISIFLLLFLILNKFHFHIDLWNAITYWLTIIK